MSLGLSIATSAPAESDEQLAQRAAGGDEKAFQELFERKAPGVFTLAYRMVGNRADAEDVMQDAFLAFFKDLGRYRGESRIATWLYQIVLSRAINLRKKRGAYNAKLSRFAEGTRGRDAASLDTRVQEALDALSERDRSLAVLRYFVGLSYEDLAQVGGFPLGTVKSRMFRVHQELRKHLSGEEVRS